MKAVITADIVNYTNLSIEDEDIVIKTVYDTFGSGIDIRTNVEDSSFVITRGDNIFLLTSYFIWS